MRKTTLVMGLVAAWTIGLVACDTDNPSGPTTTDVAADTGGPADTSATDHGTTDPGPTDTGPVDTGPVDTGPVDTGPVDTGPVDTGPVDTGPVHMTWTNGISAIFKSRCAGCHGWANDYGKVAQRIVGGTMKPKIIVGHKISGADKQAVLDWIDDGYPE